MKVVSDTFIWRALACMVAASTWLPSSNTHSALPDRRSPAICPIGRPTMRDRNPQPSTEALALINARLVDPASRLDQRGDLLGRGFELLQVLREIALDRFGNALEGLAIGGEPGKITSGVQLGADFSQVSGA